MQVHSRVCRLVFLPAYIAVYQYGTRYKQGTSGVIVPQVFTAVLGGTRDGGEGGRRCGAGPPGAGGKVGSWCGARKTKGLYGD